MSPFPLTYSQSPHSSSGAAESAEGTPDTKLTSFSPDDSRPVKHGHLMSSGTPFRTCQQDPFVTPVSKPRIEQKLSATASAFQPFGVRIGPTSSTPVVAYGSGLTNPIRVPTPYVDNGVQSHTSQAGVTQQAEITQNGTFSTDTGATRCIKAASIYPGDVLPLVTLSLEKLAETGFSPKGTQRIETIGNIVYLRLSNIKEASTVYTAIKLDHPDCAVEYISPSIFGQVVSPNTRAAYSAYEGQVILTASYPINIPFDKREFEESLRALLSAEGKLSAWQKLSTTEMGTFRMVAEFYDSALASRAVQRCNGKKIKTVVVSVAMHTPDIIAQVPSHRLSPAATPTRRSGEQTEFGDILGGLSLCNTQTPRFSRSVDFSDVQHPSSVSLPYMTASTAFRLSPNSTPVLMDHLFSSSPIGPPQEGYLTGVHRQSRLSEGDLSAFKSSVCNQQEYTHRGVEDHDCHRSALQQHLFNQGFGYYGSQSERVTRGNAHFNRPNCRRQNATRNPIMQGRQYSNPAGHHNHVEINRIRQGIDVRTTVMLRNIPNKVDQAMLKSIVDESSHGRYDFMYLRIDFSNDCNVGYAFINFTDPLDIIDFVLARSNQKWHRFRSDKVAEVSYATIQGKDCLVQKFRNSSVMLEPPHYRPKLFFTLHDPFSRAGQEDEFPASDNASKLKRSCENAEHVGLFAPSAGQHLRDEQRRRRSQYDRGTSLAEREEFGFDDYSLQDSYRGYTPY